MNTQVRALMANDFEQWKPLFEGYCDFYNFPVDEHKVATQWGWLMDSHHMLQGLVACDIDGHLLGIAHYHAWPISLFGTEVCYLSDLFVDPEQRGNGAGKALYEYLISLCQKNSWPALTLLTQEGNHSARSLYDQYGEASDFRFYLTPIEEEGN